MTAGRQTPDQPGDDRSPSPAPGRPAAVDQLLADIDHPSATEHPVWSSQGRGSGLADTAEVWSTPAAYVYRFTQPDAAAAFGGWLERLAAAAPFATPTLVGSVDGWLVTARPATASAAEPDRHAEPGLLAAAVGHGLRQIHDLPPALLGPSATDDATAEVTDLAGWGVVVARCRAAVAAGRVDAADLVAPYDRYEPERLLDLLAERFPDGVDRDRAPVLCHGAADPARFAVDAGRFAGLDRWDGPLVADPHLDLAAAHLGVQRSLGAEAVYGLYEGYGSDPELIVLDRAILAVVLLS
jgi:aminoglycoside phosphotransferase